VDVVKFVEHIQKHILQVLKDAIKWIIVDAYMKVGADLVLVIVVNVLEKLVIAKVHKNG